jgi:hypothetical protein
MLRDQSFDKPARVVLFEAFHFYPMDPLALALTTNFIASFQASRFDSYIWILLGFECFDLSEQKKVFHFLQDTKVVPVNFALVAASDHGTFGSNLFYSYANAFAVYAPKANSYLQSLSASPVFNSRNVFDPAKSWNQFLEYLVNNQ